MEKLTVVELKDKCKAAGLPTKGTKKELIERLEKNNGKETKKEEPKEEEAEEKSSTEESKKKKTSKRNKTESDNGTFTRRKKKTKRVTDDDESALCEKCLEADSVLECDGCGCSLCEDCVVEVKKKGYDPLDMCGYECSF